MAQQTREILLRLLVCSAVVASANRVSTTFAVESVAPRHWWAFTDHGDKPGVGYVLVDKGGEITGAHFFLLMLDSPENDSGRFFRMTIVKREEKALTADVQLFNAQKQPNGGDETRRVRIAFQDRFDGNHRVRADITFPEKKNAGGQVQHVVFVLQGDDWKAGQRDDGESK